jgi:Cdc6-like AAA superfamily ATPase
MPKDTVMQEQTQPGPVTDTTSREQSDGGPQTAVVGNEPTFTQEDLNRIISDRLNKERAKLTAELSSREDDLQRREYRLAARETLTKRGYLDDTAVEIISVLNASNADELNRALDIIEKHMSYSKENFDAAVLTELNKKLMQGTPRSITPQPETANIRKAMNLK